MADIMRLPPSGLSKKEQVRLMSRLRGAGKRLLKYKNQTKRGFVAGVEMGSIVAGGAAAGWESTWEDGQGLQVGGWSVGPITGASLAVAGAFGLAGKKASPALMRFGAGATSFYAGNFVRNLILTNRAAKKLSGETAQ